MVGGASGILASGVPKRSRKKLEIRSAAVVSFEAASELALFALSDWDSNVIVASLERRWTAARSTNSKELECAKKLWPRWSTNSSVL